jgi:hypothetical protein
MGAMHKFSMKSKAYSVGTGRMTEKLLDNHDWRACGQVLARKAS